MHSVVLKDAGVGDFETICQLNLAEVQHTSAIDTARLGALANLACYRKVASVNGSVAGFLLAMRDGAAYENENFARFARKYARFVYADRIVVSPAFKGLGIGSLLCQDLFRYARNAAIPG